jgi:molecular chaperone DnaK (HSP70)
VDRVTSRNAVVRRARFRKAGSGWSARRRASQPWNMQRAPCTLFDIFLGRSIQTSTFSSTSTCVPCRIVERGDSSCVGVLVQGGNRTLTPEEVTATIMLQSADSFLGAAVMNAALTVPVDFSDAQCEATRDDARTAGLSAVRIIKKPIAAATAHGLEQGGGEKNKSGL